MTASPAAGESETSPDGETRFPRPPASDFLTFRADARRQLGDDEFRVLDACYVETAQSFKLPDPADEEVIARLIYERLVGPTDTHDKTVVLRAIQAACFRQGLHIDVDLEGVLAAVEPESAVQGLTPATWDALCCAIRRSTRAWSRSRRRESAPT